MGPVGEEMAEETTKTDLGSAVAADSVKTDPGDALATDSAKLDSGVVVAADSANADSGEAVATDSANADSGEALAADSAKADAIRDEVIAQLKTVFDPEIPVNIYELGLIYKVDVAADGATQVTMTLTTPMCPAAEELPPEVETKARGVPGVTSVQLDLVWDPPWSTEMMSDAAKLDLGMT